MIAMVCVSVISTGFVMHISGISQPMPKWIKRVFLDIIPRCLCLSPGEPRDHGGEKVTSQWYCEGSDGKENMNSCERKESCTEFEKYNDSVDLLRFMTEDISGKNKQIIEHLQWRRLAIVVDRVLLYLFTLFVVLSTASLFVQIVNGGRMDHDEIMRKLDDEEWV